MAQVYIPDVPCVREQIEQPTRTVDSKGRLSRWERFPEQRMRRRFGIVDLLVILVIIAGIALIVLAASHWTAHANPTFSINLSFVYLPIYAGYSLLRMLLAYVLSLVFTLIYGHIAATNRRAETIMIPILDILQSIPILSFLPAVIVALVALFPHSNVGLELSSV